MPNSELHKGRIKTLEPVLDFHSISRYLYIGSVPPGGDRLAKVGFDAVILCAREIQPPRSYYPGVSVKYYPMDDSIVTKPLFHVAINAAKTARKLIDNKKNVLVTCQMGINRSAFVTALCLMLPPFGANVSQNCLSAPAAIELIRKKRFHYCLSNEHFANHLLKINRMCPERSPFQSF